MNWTRIGLTCLIVAAFMALISIMSGVDALVALIAYQISIKYLET